MCSNRVVMWLSQDVPKNSNQVKMFQERGIASSVVLSRCSLRGEYCSMICALYIFFIPI